MNFDEYVAAIRARVPRSSRGRKRGGLRRAGAVVSRMDGRRSARTHRSPPSPGRADRRRRAADAWRPLVGGRAAAADERVDWFAAGVPMLADALPTRARTSSSGRGRPTRPAGSGPGVRRTRPRCTAGTRSSRPGAAEPIERELAVDGIDELFDLIPFWPHAERVRGNGETLHFHCTDGDGEWLVAPRPGRRRRRRRARQGRRRRARHRVGPPAVPLRPADRRARRVRRRVVARALARARAAGERATGRRRCAARR